MVASIYSSLPLGAFARAQAMRRQQMELERLQTRRDVLYEDRLDGRIDTATYDQKASAIREPEEQVRQKIRNCRSDDASTHERSGRSDEADDRAADLFVEQVGAEQRRLLTHRAEGGKLDGGRVAESLREPFEELRLSNSRSDRNQEYFDPRGSTFDIWRRGGDSNPFCYLASLSYR